MQKSRWELERSPLSSITLNILKNVGNQLDCYNERHKKLARMGFIYYGKVLPNAHPADRHSYHLTKRGKRVLAKAGITTLEHNSVYMEWLNHMSAPHSDIDILYANFDNCNKDWFVFFDGDEACVVKRKNNQPNKEIVDTNNDEGKEVIYPPIKSCKLVFYIVHEWPKKTFITN